MGVATYPAEWLGLREEADAAARSIELLDPLRAYLAERPGLVIFDLGCGTGSMGRWLAGRLPGPQHWILHDRDPGLLARAVSMLPSNVTVTGEQQDITRLRAQDLGGASLVTASALLDLLTADELTGLVDACVDARCPALFALSVVGRVEFSPADPLDSVFGDAFNAHQRRGRLLGPDAVAFVADLFEQRGATVHRRSSPWRLGPESVALITEWLHGWVAAACEQQPELGEQADDYLGRRLAGELSVVVHHEDLLALPEGGSR
jgi:hypothetical protein